MTERKVMGFRDIDDILDFAIKAEEESERFYSGWSKKVTNKALEQLFDDLAREEVKHKEHLLEVKKGHTLKPSNQEIVDLKISDYMVSEEASTRMNYQDALVLAMNKEKESFKLYTGLASMTRDQDMQLAFNALAQEEAKHKLRLEIIYDDEILKED
ncbi:MAG: ferritin family protein [Candidatus Omnitrophota bacterium]